MFLFIPLSTTVTRVEHVTRPTPSILVSSKLPEYSHKIGGVSSHVCIIKTPVSFLRHWTCYRAQVSQGVFGPSLSMSNLACAM